MNVLSRNVLRGPNYWSVEEHHLIQLLFQVEKASLPTPNQLADWQKQLTNLLPAGYIGTEGLSGDYWPQLAGALALGLQQKAGIPVSAFCHVQPTIRTGEFQVIFSYAEEKSGLYAAEAAIRLIHAMVRSEELEVQAEVDQIKALWNSHKHGPSTLSIIEEAKQRNIPVVDQDGEIYIQLGYGAAQKRIQAALTCQTSCVAADIAGNKDETKRLLTQAYIPTPQGCVIHDVENLNRIIDEIGFPLVVKPLNANQGKGATTNINSRECALKSFHRAKQFSEAVIVEQFITGNDFRVLVISHRFVAAALRTPAAIIGNGQMTIQELIDAVNANPNRGNGHESPLTSIKVDDDTHEILTKNNYTLDTVLPEGKELYLKTTANLSTGGTATDVTHKVHPANIALFERASRVIGLDICGIDVMAPDLSTPLSENGGAVIEINAAPGLRMHLQPTIGQPRNVAKPIVDMLFPNNSNGRSPIVAITGTNGKTTTTRLIAHMARQAGFNTGCTTTDGIYINQELIYKGDCSGPASGTCILKDSTVDFAVLETARGGILRSGLCFDQCDTAVITNVAEDHLGLNEINTLEQLAQVKAVVAKAVAANGYAVLNADDDLVYAMKDVVPGKVALFSLYANNLRLQRHCEEGGLGAYYEDGYIVLQTGDTIIPIEEVKNIPLTFSGKAEFNVANVLATCLAAYTNRIDLNVIRQALRSFVPSGEVTPGRVNLFQFHGFSILLDYAHNAHGLRALGKLVKSFEASVKIGVIAGVGDRRDEDIVALGEEAARIFDQIIIRHDKDLRGRTKEELNELLRKGIQAAAPDKPITYLSDEAEAVHYVMTNAVTNSFITFLSEDIESVHSQLKMYHTSLTSSIRTAV